MISPAHTSPCPATSSRSLPGLSTSDRSRMPLTFNRNSETSSVTCGIVVYS